MNKKYLEYGKAHDNIRKVVMQSVDDVGIKTTVDLLMRPIAERLIFQDEETISNAKTVVTESMEAWGKCEHCKLPFNDCECL